ncbi:phosphoribosylaminoimidazolesuccinocarboxamide synthase [Aeromicrobium sp. CF3.5]|uniref:phosphoribosylaminoimidazolesuccinocarboxamide synthase n=1 Tax=Aeromicrobium sp. CF3.5 TaxID=3373078 RepID=UPI003EE5225C
MALTIPGATHLHSGKVRDLYAYSSDPGAWGTAPDPGAWGADHLLMVASDRISAYDFVLEPGIPDKGEILTRMSLWWFDQLADLVPNHVVSTEVPDVVSGRALVVQKLDMFPVECVARGYLTGSGLIDYRATGEVCGVPLPDGLVESSRLAEPIFTPATKADLGEHDENVDFEHVVRTIGADDAEALRALTLQVYIRADEIARERGIILADTKLEFGRLRSTGQIVLGDEVLTPDSSRFWPADAYAEGQVQESFDKQIVRNWLTSEVSGWDRHAGEPPPTLPPEIVDRTRARYVRAYELLTGETF